MILLSGTKSKVRKSFGTRANLGAQLGRKYQQFAQLHVAMPNAGPVFNQLESFHFGILLAWQVAGDSTTPKEKSDGRQRGPKMKRNIATLVMICLALTGSAYATAIRGGFTGSTFPGNDDGSVGGVVLPFTINFFGGIYSSTCVNNNGNISFTGCDGTYTPFGLTTGAQLPRIAPFFADVDTRSAGDPVTYGAGVVGGRTAFGVEWLNVDYFSSSPLHTNRNDFELVLIDRSDIAVGDFDIEFNYGRIQWEAGTASGSDSSGHGGVCAHAGYTNGSGVSGTNFELPGSGVCGAFLDGGVDALITHHTTNTDVAGRYLFTVRSGDVSGGEIGGGNPVPEPATLTLLGSGLVGFFLRRKRAA